MASVLPTGGCFNLLQRSEDKSGEFGKYVVEKQVMKKQ